MNDQAKDVSPLDARSWDTMGEMRESLDAWLEEVAAPGWPASKERERQFKDVMRASGAKLRQVQKEIAVKVAVAKSKEEL